MKEDGTGTGTLAGSVILFTSREISSANSSSTEEIVTRNEKPDSFGRIVLDVGDSARVWEEILRNVTPVTIEEIQKSGTRL